MNVVCVFCDVGCEFLHIMWRNITLQYIKQTADRDIASSTVGRGFYALLHQNATMHKILVLILMSQSDAD
jgi:hypothetical protein